MLPFLLILTLFIPSFVFAKEESLSIKTSNDKSIHYNRHIIETTISSITPIGYFEFETSKENGEGRIFSEYNIGGFGRTVENPWRKFTAKSHGLKYGLKQTFEQGTLTAGIGVKKYQGSTGCKIDGCKDIESTGWGIKTAFERNDGNAIELDYKQTWATPTQYHPFSVAPFPVIQNATQKKRDLILSGRYQDTLFSVGHQLGTRRDVYSVLIPEIDQSFRNTSLMIAPEITLFGHKMNVGPRFCSGSNEGDLAELDIDACWGMALVTEIHDASVSLNFNKIKAKGDISYDEYAVTEAIDNERIDLDIKSEKWALSFFSFHRKHTGDFDIFAPALIFLAGNITTSINTKTTQEYGLVLTRFINDHLSLSAALTTMDVKGQFYENPKLDENGQKVDFGVRYQF